MKYKYLTIILAVVPMLAFADVPGKTLTPVEPTRCELASLEDCDNEIRSFWSATDKVEKVAMKPAPTTNATGCANLSTVCTVKRNRSQILTCQNSGNPTKKNWNATANRKSKTRHPEQHQIRWVTFI